MSDLKPYRVQWRASYSTNWALIKDFDDRDHAAIEAKECVSKWHGQARIITQHVIETVGLNSR